MYYGYNPYSGWPYPWGPPMGAGYPMTGAWGYPYGGMGQMPFYPQPGGYGAPGMSPLVSLVTHLRGDLEIQVCQRMTKR